MGRKPGLVKCTRTNVLLLLRTPFKCTTFHFFCCLGVFADPTGGSWTFRVLMSYIFQIVFDMSRWGFLGLAVDRFVAIKYPIKYQLWGKTKFGWKVVFGFLLFVTIINSSYLFNESFLKGKVCQFWFCLMMLQYCD